MKSEFGLIGLGVMGKSLSRNLAQKGFRLSLFNRHVTGKEENVARNFKAAYPELKSVFPFDELDQFVQSLEQPRKILLMVNAGAAVDAVLAELIELLDEGDVVIDGGNSHFEDTNRRISRLKKNGLHFIGAGISGGEKGALKGPSIMPSGEKTAYQKVESYLEAIAAKDNSGKPCCTYVGGEGSGHFVKMVHNGIEYVEMQLLAECYSVLKAKGQSNEEIADMFENWKEDAESYLLTITIEILRKKQGEHYLLDQILDKAENKGTGSWATHSIADMGEPATLMPAALFARYLSSMKEKRAEIAQRYETTKAKPEVTGHQLKEAYQFARLINHKQGFTLIKHVSEQNSWGINLSETARIWTEGCIIKSDLMLSLMEKLKSGDNLLLNPSISARIEAMHPAAKLVAAECMRCEIHAPCLIESANYFHGLKTGNSTANLIQAQRDYFGAHTYRRVDRPNESFHTEW